MFFEEALAEVQSGAVDGASQAAEEAVQTVSNGGFDWSAIKETLVSWLMSTGIKIVIALLILVVSYKIINLIARKIEKKNKNNPNPKLDKTIVDMLAECMRAEWDNIRAEKK